jgi:hypothetical protein
MSIARYFSFDHSCKTGNRRITPKDAVVPIVSLDSSSLSDTSIKNLNFYEANWYKKAV